MGESIRRFEERARSRLFGSPKDTKRIGRFRIIGRLGQGGMGTVYSAYDDRLDRKVAIKRLRDAQHSSKDDRLRLQREALALARLSHPNVVPVFEVGEADGELFLAMEYVRGQTLRTWLKTRPKWPLVLDAFIQAGRGLIAAHEAGLVHRDLKPANMIRGDDGVVKVFDFGLARVDYVRATVPQGRSEARFPALTSLTRNGAILGTPAYMAPEQHRGKPGDARSDQYAFCASLWQALLGTRPFAGRSLYELEQSKLRGPPLWPKRAFRVPRSIVNAIRRGMSVRAEARWPDMASLLARLESRSGQRRLQTAGLLGFASVAAFGLHGDLWADVEVTACGTMSGVAWGEQTRREVRTAFFRTGKTYAADVWSQTDQSLASYSEAWAGAFGEACRLKPREEYERLERDMKLRCLEEGARGVAAAVRLLKNADVDVVRNAHQLVSSLPAPTRCDGELHGNYEPLDTMKGIASMHLQHQLLDAKNHRIVGHAATARAKLDALSADLPAGGPYEDLRSESMLEDAQLLASVGDHEAALAKYEAAEELAATLRRWGAVAQALQGRMKLLGAGERSRGDALLFRPQLVGASRGKPRREAAALQTCGEVLTQLGEYGKAEADFVEAIELLAEAGEPWHPRANASRSALAYLMLLRGELPAAAQQLRGLLEIQSRVLGRTHPEVIQTRSELGEVLRRLGEPEAAYIELRGALAALYEGDGAEAPEKYEVFRRLGQTATALSRYEDAEDMLRASMTLEQSSMESGRVSLGVTRVALAMALLGQGNDVDALSEAEEGWSEVLASEAPLGVRIEAAFVFARVLYHAGDRTNRVRAHRLVRDELQRAALVGYGDTRLMARMQGWLWSTGFSEARDEGVEASL